MKPLLIKLFWPILRFFESDVTPEHYQKSHRVALLILGSVFLVLSIGSAWVASGLGGFGGLVPVLFFFLLGSVAIIVGTLGSNAAVSRIWGTK